MRQASDGHYPAATLLENGPFVTDILRISELLAKLRQANEAPDPYRAIEEISKELGPRPAAEVQRLYQRVVAEAGRRAAGLLAAEGAGPRPEPAGLGDE